ncbi:P pilus assembly/Cpx signaling pathway, periplasmic inhibitor/zinc-resistance associated protein [Shewanella psychrophila]|uniref:P pilus assembly/Cpx signaling pathway, periplasmic inhibitor/zinc-resistance associated protein n=1 Tax=Shewanella psychrophila TaxID=225848 RepID=A0A1S6HJ55_9GAMM|nr:Spy/CpxP family protein refolding chaperone [Shewanella psychrophila]AQS35556.1 P pilus assembly/Cpx signaling pathway, periplasmic inhibitor/zinc-resistance associated protein [Shewanella psychrophila]
MKKNTFKAGLLAIVASTALMTSAVYAEDGQHDGQHHMKSERMGHHGGMRQMFRGLDLTDEQKTEIKSLMKEQKSAMKENRPSKEERQAKKAEFLSLITADNFDEAKAQELMQARQDNAKFKKLGMLEVQNKIYKLLTPEQQEQFKDNFEKGHSRKGGH